MGLISKLFSWGNSATFSDTTTETWLAGLGVVLVLAFLWATVVRDIMRETATAL